MSLNIKSWKKIRFGDLIDAKKEIYKGKPYSQSELEFCKPYEKNAIAYVTRTDLNNSVFGFAIKNDSIINIEKGNAIVVGDTTATITYQRDEFICGDHIVIIRPKWLDEYTGMFFSTLLNKERYRYNYGRAFLKDNILNTSILVPTNGGNIDFKEIKNIIKKQKNKYITTNNLKNTKTFDVKKWKEFTFGNEELFKVYAGNYHYDSEYDNGKTPYITATNKNNGVNEYINIAPEFYGNVITIEKVNACTFYQRDDFCATSDVNIVETSFPMNKYIALFIATVVNFNENYRWNYGRQCRVGNTKKMKIALPAKTNNDGEYIPDVEYMEQYVKSLPYGDRI